LKHIGDLPDLESLSLNFTSVSDDGVSHLSELKRLEYLGLAETEITDAQFVSLEEMTGLQFIDLRGTPVTNVGVERLRKVLPNRTIQRWLVENSLRYLRCKLGRTVRSFPVPSLCV